MHTAAFERIHSCRLSEDGETINLWLEMEDGSIRSVYWHVTDLVGMAGEISPPLRAPANAVLQ